MHWCNYSQSSHSLWKVSWFDNKLCGHPDFDPKPSSFFTSTTRGKNKKLFLNLWHKSTNTFSFQRCWNVKKKKKKKMNPVIKYVNNFHTSQDNQCWGQDLNPCSESLVLVCVYYPGHNYYQHSNSTTISWMISILTTLQPSPHYMKKEYSKG